MLRYHWSHGQLVGQSVIRFGDKALLRDSLAVNKMSDSWFSSTGQQLHRMTELKLNIWLKGSIGECLI